MATSCASSNPSAAPAEGASEGKKDAHTFGATDPAPPAPAPPAPPAPPLACPPAPPPLHAPAATASSAPAALQRLVAPPNIVRPVTATDLKARPPSAPRSCPTCAPGRRPR